MSPDSGPGRAEGVLRSELFELSEDSAHASAEIEHPIAVGSNLGLLLTQNSVS